MVHGGYSRYVALGDSQTEGLWDGDDTVGVAGFADRLATILDRHYPGLLYANLAIRGKRIRDVIDAQIPRALEMRPDLITVCIGMNDATSAGRTFHRALGDLDAMYGTLAQTGATVVTTTFPDITKILPLGRLIAGRIVQINDVISDAARRHGFGLVDLYNAPSMGQPQTWSHDRMHASSAGHTLFAEAAAEALNLPGSSHDWAQVVESDDLSTFWERQGAQLRWTQNLLLPFLWRTMRGKSAGDGREPKRGTLTPVSPVGVESELDRQR